LRKKLTLISAPAGFGKTTLLSEWIHGTKWPVAWLSLDEGDNDLSRFLTYFITALQTVAANFGDGLLGALQSPRSSPIESLLMALINEMAEIALDVPEDTG
jgi:LuxR family maltose regulon positive regulatory protein